MKLSTPAMEFTLKVNVLPPFAVTEENVGAAGKVIVKVVDTVSETLLNLA